jgi:hypothetical protein
MEDIIMRLFEITFYSIDEGCLTPEINWIVEASDLEEVMNRCNELNNHFKGGMLSARCVSSMKLDDLTVDRIIEVLEYL